MQIAIMVLQQKALMLGIKCINKAIVFDLLTKVSTWATPEVINGDVYYFVARQKVSDELPILHLKDDTIYRHFKDLATLELIDYIKIGKKDCIKLTEKGKSYLSKNDDFAMSEMNPNYYVGNESEKIENSEMNPKKLGNESEKTRNEIRHINKLDYQETKDINTSSLHSEVILKSELNLYLENWNLFAKQYQLSVIQTLTNSRTIKLKARIKEHHNFFSIFETACKKISLSDFLLGKKQRWKATFDWLIENDKNILKVIEGNYDNEKNNVVSAYVAMRQQGLTLKDMEQMQ